MKKESVKLRSRQTVVDNTRRIVEDSASLRVISIGLKMMRNCFKRYDKANSNIDFNSLSAAGGQGPNG